MNKVCMLSFLSAFAGVAQAGLPLAPTVTYGLIRDEYGQPLSGSADVLLVKEATPDTACASMTIDGLLAFGVNYRLSLELEDLTSPLVRPYAANVGTAMRVIVKIGGVEQPLTPTPTFSAPAAGVARRVDFATATDADGDGLPDAWEELMVAWSDGLFTSIRDIRPDDDSDKDGMTNLQEYLAGTFPFLRTDLFSITQTANVPGTGRMALTFATSDTRTYHILSADRLDSPVWSPTQSSATPDGELLYQTYPGTGRTVTVYVDASRTAAFFRIGAN